MVGYKYETPEFAQIMKLAAELNLVIQIHSSTPEMQYLAENFPHNTIVFPHLGVGRDNIYARIDLVAKHQNTYFDVAGSGIERVGILEHAVKEIGIDRVLYGSAEIRRRVDLHRRFQKAAAMITHLNLRRWLGER